MKVPIQRRDARSWIGIEFVVRREFEAVKSLVGDRKMKFNRLAFVVAFFLTAVLFAEIAVHAQEANHSGTTFSQLVEKNR